MSEFKQLVSSFDTAIAEWVAQFHNESLVAFFAGVSLFGSWQFILVLSAILSAWLLFYQKRVWLLMLLVSSAVTSLGVLILKEVFARSRPVEGVMYGDSLYSFPSGHTSFSAVFYLFVACLIYTHVQRVWVRLVCTVALVALVLVISFSRVYLGAHFATDVLAGIALGVIGLCVGFALARYGRAAGVGGARD